VKDGDSPPGFEKQPGIETPIKACHKLLNIDTTFRLLDMVKQHALLHRGQWK